MIWKFKLSSQKFKFELFNFWPLISNLLLITYKTAQIDLLNVQPILKYKFPKLSCFKKNRDCFKITWITSSPFNSAGLKPKLRWFSQKKFWAKSKDPSYFLVRFDMQWAYFPFSGLRRSSNKTEKSKPSKGKSRIYTWYIDQILTSQLNFETNFARNKPKT